MEIVGSTTSGTRRPNASIAAQHPALERVLPEVAPLGFDVHLVYADALRQSKRVAAFRDFAVKSSKDWQY